MTPYAARARRPWWLRATGWTASIGVHIVLATLLIQHRVARTETSEDWIEMAIVETAAPEAPPQPEPEPPPPKPVDFKETVSAPEAEPPPRPVRRVTGLSARSFARGQATGLSVRAGTTLAQKADDETMGLGEAAQPVSYTAATTRPKCKKPPIDERTVPPEIREQGVEGTVHVEIDIDMDGSVSAVRVARSLHPIADKACAAMWRRARCRPGEQNGTPVPVVRIPHRCTYRAIP